MSIICRPNEAWRKAFNHDKETGEHTADRFHRYRIYLPDGRDFTCKDYPFTLETMKQLHTTNLYW